MKTKIALLLLLGCVIAAVARLGDGKRELYQRYGRVLDYSSNGPVERCTYKTPDFSVTVILVSNRSESETFFFEKWTKSEDLDELKNRVGGTNQWKYDWRAMDGMRDEQVFTNGGTQIVQDRKDQWLWIRTPIGRSAEAFLRSNNASLRMEQY